MTKKQKIEFIADQCEIITRNGCNRCGTEEEVYFDGPEGLAKEMLDNGWTVVDTPDGREIVCPECKGKRRKNAS